MRILHYTCVHVCYWHNIIVYTLPQNWLELEPTLKTTLQSEPSFLSTFTYYNFPIGYSYMVLIRGYWCLRPQLTCAYYYVDRLVNFRHGYGHVLHEHVQNTCTCITWACAENMPCKNTIMMYCILIIMIRLLWMAKGICRYVYVHCTCTMCVELCIDTCHVLHTFKDNT